MKTPLLLLLALPLAAQTFTYSQFDVPSPGRRTAVRGIDSFGTLYGDYYVTSDASVTGTNGFIASPALGTFGHWQVPGANSTRVNGVSPTQGQVVGSFANEETYRKIPPYWIQFGPDGHQLANIRPFTVPGSSDSRANSVNDQGTIAGWYRTANGEPTHGFSYGGGAFTSFDFPGAWSTFGQGVDSRGKICGYFAETSSPTSHTHGFYSDNFTWEQIDVTDPDGYDTQVVACNTAGHMVGQYITVADQQFHSFYYDGVNFVRIDFPGAAKTIVYAINENDEIGGTFAAEVPSVPGAPKNYLWHGFYATLDR